MIGFSLSLTGSSLTGHQRDHGDVICLPEPESGLGNDLSRRHAETRGTLEAEEFATTSGFGHSISKQGEAVAAGDLKRLLRESGFRVEPEWQCGSD